MTKTSKYININLSKPKLTELHIKNAVKLESLVPTLYIRGYFELVLKAEERCFTSGLAVGQNLIKSVQGQV